ncbi:HAD family phosphatase [Hydrogenophaga sp.]|uniref:HAD family hydrolase n=1 Tax=Hydrogenophaga sp. TaxID=1904254 RepID=UPI00260C9864|nr:HAD family phosphatase [Hydrogenophaga sp.]
MWRESAALLFDLDGTLIDSMTQHQQAWTEWHRRHGLPIDEATFFAATAGRSNAEILADLLPGRPAADHLAWADEKEALYRDIARRTLTLVAGAQDFVQRARAGGYRLAVCTASTPENMALAFERFGIDGWVDCVVSPSDGLRGKPHPDIFLEAARRLGCAAHDCVVFEDAPLGIEAARRARMRAVALTTTLPAPAFSGYDNLIALVPDFLAPSLLTPSTDPTSSHA